MALNKSELPSKSILRTDGHVYDYIDSFTGVFIDNNKNMGLHEIGKSLFTSAPKWIGYLFILRNRIVRLFGLKTSGKKRDREKQLINFKCEPGEQLGLFKVFNKTDTEIVLGEDDKHLNFRVSLLIDKKTSSMNKRTLTISTAVNFNNWFGRLYFLTVRPFHKLIVPSMLKGIIRELEKK